MKRIFRTLGRVGRIAGRIVVPDVVEAVEDEVRRRRLPKRVADAVEDPAAELPGIVRRRPRGADPAEHPADEAMRRSADSPSEYDALLEQKQRIEREQAQVDTVLPGIYSTVRGLGAIAAGVGYFFLPVEVRESIEKALEPAQVSPSTVAVSLVVLGLALLGVSDGGLIGSILPGRLRKP